MKVSFKFSTMHWFFPKIIMWIIAILFVILVIQRIIKCIKTKTPFINLKGYHFFQPNYDKVKFWGALILLVAYFATLVPLGFLLSSCIFISLFALLFSEAIYGRQGFKFQLKPAITSVLVGVISSTFIWYLFYHIFNITLP